ncbi:magnesium and cobalt transport protein CorA [Nocardiopsis sp. NPDC006198]|uniref:magnesium and cobalt transport protein CorA n=1 Tax=Nocardiopsis sp. NPDC006198 TaxID=3154472 RepID=UPI0033B8941A
MHDSSPERVMALGHEAARLPARDSPGAVRAVLYRDGRREREADSVEEARLALARDSGLMAWISMDEPDQEQLTDTARHFSLPRLALEDAIVAHQRPKVETYGDVLFVVLRPAHYDREREAVRVGELHLFGGRGFVITIRHRGQVDVEAVRGRLEAEPRVLAHGSLAVVLAVLDRVVDAYAPVVFDIQDDIDEVETQVLDSDPEASRRTYRLARQVIVLHRAVDPLDVVMTDLMTLLERPEEADPGPPHAPAEARGTLHNLLRDVADHVSAVREHAEGFRQILQNIMSVNSALIDQAQNEAMKKVSSWGGILVVPTLIASAYGMNIPPGSGFEWMFSWPLSLLLMALSSLTLYVVFRRNGWL